MTYLILPNEEAAVARETTLDLPAIGGFRPRVSVICIDVSDERLFPVRGQAALELLGLRQRGAA